MKLEVALRHVLQDENRKPLARIVVELAHCLMIERELPAYYFTSLLHKVDVGDYRKFIGHRKISRINRKLFDMGADIELLENKINFAQHMEAHGLPSPRILGHSEGRTIIADQRQVAVESPSELRRYIQELGQHSPTGRLFIKPREGLGGKIAFKVDRIINDEDILRLHGLMPTYQFLFQEHIVQSQEIGRIYANSINTIRIHTYVDSLTRHVRVFCPLMRIGTGGRVVDNGGLFVPIDQDTWTLRSTGWSLLQKGGRSFSSHPDTGVEFAGIKIPGGQEIERLCVSAAKLFDRSFIGWDIALTPDGPVLIEGNHNPHTIMAQIASGGIKDNNDFLAAFQVAL